MQIFRVRLVLRMTAPARMHAQHAAILYATLAQAHGATRKVEPCVPDGVLLDAPEQARLWLAQGSAYAFGFTLLASGSGEAGRIVDQLAQGLRKVGRRKVGAKLALGGNFDLELVQDLVANETHRTGHPLQPIARDWIDGETERVAGLPSFTLRFLSPLRAHRGKKARRDGHQFFDREHFQTSAFVQRIVARLHGLRIEPWDKLPACQDGLPHRQAGSLSHEGVQPTVASNRLVWLDLSYGPRQTRKALGGAVGRLTLTNLNPAAVAALVWGQYVRIGEATRFGFGHYRIEELGPPPFACARGTDLLTLVAEHPALDEAAAKWELGGGEAREAARQLAAGDYEPRPHFRVEIPKPDGGRRVLSIPSRLDRVLQRGVLDVIGPAVDLFLEESSLAYRRGLGRHTAARRLKTAFAEGFRWALRADFLDFFNALDHGQLQERIAAYTADDALTAALMRWVKSGSPHEGRGIPTGAPLSPLLANLFLDEFDEAMERLGRRLVRYADDFLILFRDRADADAVLDEARRTSTALQLELNRDKTRTLSLDAPFEFLGFRFEPRELWELAATDGPQPVEALGGKEWNRSRPRPHPPRVDGEQD